MISKCQLIKFIQLLHFIMTGFILTVPFTLYKPLIAISVYILVPIVFISYFMLNGRCLFDFISDEIYGEKKTSDQKNCPNEDILDFWLFNKCKQNNMFGILSFIIFISFFILYPPTPYFRSIFNQEKIRWFNIVLFGVCIAVIISGVYYKVGKQMKNYPKCV